MRVLRRKDSRYFAPQEVIITLERINATLPFA